MPRGLRVDGQKLEALRELRAYSRADVADLLGLSTVAIWKIETRGMTMPRTARKLAKLYGVEPEEITLSQRPVA